MVAVGARREVAAESHGDGACRDLGEAGDYDDAGGGHRGPGESRGQRERHGQAVGHSDHHVPDDVRGFEMRFHVQCLVHEFNIIACGVHAFEP